MNDCFLWEKSDIQKASPSRVPTAKYKPIPWAQELSYRQDGTKFIRLLGDALERHPNTIATACVLHH